jgi:hypothetical protein
LKRDAPPPQDLLRGAIAMPTLSIVRRVPHVTALCALVAALLTVAQVVGAQALRPAEASNMRLVGSQDLQARSAYQPTIHHQGSRWIAYIGHHGGTEAIPEPVNALTGKRENNGTSVVDVTDPAHPVYLAHIPGDPGLAESGGAQMARVCDGKLLPKGDPAKTYLLRTRGNSAHEIWDVSDPKKPTLVTSLSGGITGTHKNFWECDTGIAYLVSGVPDWRTRRMTQIYDLSDPTHPRFIRNFGLAGQEPGSTGPVPTELHGPISTGPAGNRVYFGYGTNRSGIVQIVDRQKLLTGDPAPTAANLNAPEISRIALPDWTGAHTAFPLLGVTMPEFAQDKDVHVHDFIVATNEAIQNECLEGRQMVWIIDITHERVPFGVATYTPSEAAGHFCARGGRFGTHSSNESMAPIFYRKLMFFAAFNAGVRAVDVRDPYHPREVGYYIPAETSATDKRCVGTGATEHCKVAIQTNNVDVDERGYVYIVDRANTGLHILELTEAARAIVDAP